jgi:hypothetical protein
MPESDLQKKFPKSNGRWDTSIYQEDSGVAIFPNILILVSIAVVLALPILIWGPLPNAHDGTQHLNYARHFADQFWSGDWSPKWLLGMNHGLGSPSLFVYPPFVSYVYVLLQPAGNVLHFDAFNAGMFLALLCSGIAAFLWLQTMVTRRIATAAAVLYMLTPYHLAIDLYRRCALSECWALVWIPLFLYFAAQTKSRTAIVGMAVAYALLIVSHLVSVVMFTPLAIAVAILLPPRTERLRCVLHVIAGMSVGTGLSAFYLLPALSHAKYFPVEPVLGSFQVSAAENAIDLQHLVSGTSSGAGFVHWVSLVVFSMAAFIAVCGLISTSSGESRLRKSSLFWISVSALCLFLMSRASLRIWTTFPALLKAVQYQWRLTIPLCLAAAFLFAAFLATVTAHRGWSRMSASAIVFLIIVAWVVIYGQVWRRYRTPTERAPSDHFLVNDDDGWFRSWSAPDMDQESTLRASVGPKIRFVSGDAGTSELQVWRARHIEFKTNSPAGGWVMVNQFYFPEWAATADQTRIPLQVKAALPEGLMAVDVPAGAHKIDVEIPVSRTERLGIWMSLLSATFIPVIVWNKKLERVNLNTVRSAEAVLADN